MVVHLPQALASSDPIRIILALATKTVNHRYTNTLTSQREKSHLRSMAVGVGVGHSQLFLPTGALTQPLSR